MTDRCKNITFPNFVYGRQLYKMRFNLYDVILNMEKLLCEILVLLHIDLMLISCLHFAGATSGNLITQIRFAPPRVAAPPMGNPGSAPAIVRRPLQRPIRSEENAKKNSCSKPLSLSNNLKLVSVLKFCQI